MDQNLISEIEEMAVKFFEKDNKNADYINSIFEKCAEVKDIETRRKIACVINAMLRDQSFKERVLAAPSWVTWAKENRDLLHNNELYSKIIVGANEFIKRLNLDLRVVDLNESGFN